jgi:hypothetical protein
MHPPPPPVLDEDREPPNQQHPAPNLPVVELSDRQEDTPQTIKDSLLWLRNRRVSELVEGGLVEEVAIRSRYTLAWSFDLFHVRLFRAEKTEESRSVHWFKCPHPDCQARLKFQIDEFGGEDTVRLYEEQWMHSHPIQCTRCRGLSSLTHAQRDAVMECVNHNMSSAQIHQKFDFLISPALLADLQRNAKAKLRSGEAAELKQFLDGRTDVDFKWRMDKVTGTFVGCYMLFKPAQGTQAATGVLVMDDTACTNHFGLPLFLIVGINEHGRNQIIAWAFLFDRTAQEFAKFLKWAKKRLAGAGQPIRSPTAIIVDRHEGQFSAIRQVFPDAQVCFCVKHLAQNIASRFGATSIVHQQFWQLIKGERTEKRWLELLDREVASLLQHVQGNSPKFRMLQWLCDNLKHYSPSWVFQFTSDQASVRVEGTFGVLKRMLNHQKVTLRVLVDAIIKLAWEGVRKWLLPRRKAICGRDILPLPMQMFIGDQAAKTLREEVRKLRSWNWISQHFNRDAAEAKQCCLVAKRWGLPCLHLMLLRTEAGATQETKGVEPLLTLFDFPPHVILPNFSEREPLLPPDHRTKLVDMKHALRDGEWSRSHLTDRFEPIINAAAGGDPRARDCLTKCWEEYYQGTDAPPAFFDGRTRDPVRPRKRGGQNERPSHNSGLYYGVRKGRRSRSCGSARCCSRCHQPGHNCRKCTLPAILRGEIPED